MQKRAALVCACDRSLRVAPWVVMLTSLPVSSNCPQNVNAGMLLSIVRGVVQSNSGALVAGNFGSPELMLDLWEQQSTPASDATMQDFKDQHSAPPPLIWLMCDGLLIKLQHLVALGRSIHQSFGSQVTLFLFVRCSDCNTWWQGLRRFVHEG